MNRSCGVLLPIASLPSPYGVGTLGKAAYDFIDFLKKAGQSWWQILPVGPTSYGDSPYQSLSTYAGNPYMIDLDMLCADGLLKKSEYADIDWGGDAACIDYEALYRNRFTVLKIACDRGYKAHEADVAAFAEANRGWLGDYALFMALKRHFGMKPWYDWDEDIRLRKPEAVARYTKLLEEDIRLFTFIQYLFFHQWSKLRDYAHNKGIGIIGDLPIYVAMDSADVWAEPEMFLLDAQNQPIEVAGVPPDYFNEDGQLWGNPLYDWDAMRQNGFGWWIRRVDGARRLYDVLRIDHFRAFESYWAVPFGEPTAKIGRWVKGPGMDLIGVLTSWFYDMQFIAEDLGILTPDVHKLLKDSGLPGMKVLEFAFNAKELSKYLPHAYESECVCYAGTHDNAPLMAWKEEANPEDVAFAKQYLGLNDAEGFHWGVLRGGLSSVASLFIAQLQDYLGLGAEARINTPGVPSGNWRWRLKPNQIPEGLAEKMEELAYIYGRKDRVKPAPTV